MHSRVESSLQENGITFTVRRHSDCAKPIKSPHDFAVCLGYDLNRITKTLFVRSANRDLFLLVVAPMGGKVDFAAIATAFNCSRIEVASQPELSERIGYPPNGVSPLGVPNVKVAMDESLLKHSTILIGSGVTGIEVELPPKDLATSVAATVLKLT